MPVSVGYEFLYEKKPADVHQTSQIDEEMFLCFSNKAIPGQDIQG